MHKNINNAEKWKQTGTAAETAKRPMEQMKEVDVMHSGNWTTTLSFNNLSTLNEKRCMLRDVAKEYLKLVHTMDSQLHGGGPRPGLRVIADASQALAKRESAEDDKSSGIGFVELFRRRLHYERLGIPLTPVELIYMDDYEREWRRLQDSNSSLEIDMICQCQSGSLQITANNENECAKQKEPDKQTKKKPDDHGQMTSEAVPKSNHNDAVCQQIPRNFPSINYPAQSQFNTLCTQNRCFEGPQMKRLTGGNEQFRHQKCQQCGGTIGRDTHGSPCFAAQPPVPAPTSPQRPEHKQSTVRCYCIHQNCPAQQLPSEEQLMIDLPTLKRHKRLSPVRRASVSPTQKIHTRCHTPFSNNIRSQQQETRAKCKSKQLNMAMDQNHICQLQHGCTVGSLAKQQAKALDGSNGEKESMQSSGFKKYGAQATNAAVANINSKLQKDLIGEVSCIESPALNRSQELFPHCAYCNFNCAGGKQSAMTNDIGAQETHQHALETQQEQQQLCESSPASSVKPSDLSKLPRKGPEKSYLQKLKYNYDIAPESELECSRLNDSKLPAETTERKCTMSDQRLVALCFKDTLTDVWHKAGGRIKDCSPAQRMQDSLYTNAAKPKFQPIDVMHAGFAGQPILDAEAQRMAPERSAYFAQEFAKLSQEQRMRHFKLRLKQVRIFQESSDRNYKCCLQASCALNWRQMDMHEITTSHHSCPMGKPSCPPLLESELLAHFVTDHLSEPGLELQEIFAHDRMLIVFNTRAFDLDQNACMGLIVYGGLRGNKDTFPARCYMPVINKSLPDAYQRYAGHLPLLVMICRTRLSSLGHRRVRFQDERKLPAVMRQQQQQHDEDVFAVWVVSMSLPQPVHVLMTVFNRRLDVTRSAIMQVRSLRKSHRCNKFLRRSSHCMRLSEQDMQLLTSDFNDPLYMELSVREYAGRDAGQSQPRR